MSELKNFNDDMVFQSFSKNPIFESNKDNNKTSQNDLTEFSFKKNLFLQKSDDNNNFNKNHISSINDHIASNIYSKNDNNILESGHFGQSKYDSKNYKEIIEKNALKKQPLFYIEEKYNRMKEEEEEKNAKNTSGIKSNNSNSSLFKDRLKKIQIIRKKKIKNNNSINYNRIKKLKDDSFNSMRNNIINDEKSYLYKKKFTNNNINLNISNISNLNNIKDNTYDECKVNKTFYRVNNTINANEIPKYIKNNKYEFCNIYRNNAQNKKILANNSTGLNKIKLKEINSNYILKNLKENKENNHNYNNIILNNPNIHNLIINNNHFCPNLGNIKFINFEPEKTYRNIYKVNKYSNKIIKNENLDKKKNYKRNNNLIAPTCSLGVLPRNKNIKFDKENKIKSNNTNISYANSKLNTINNKSIGLYKTRTHYSKIDNKKVKNIPSKKSQDKIKLLKERMMNWFVDKNNF